MGFRLKKQLEDLQTIFKTVSGFPENDHTKLKVEEISGYISRTSGAILSGDTVRQVGCVYENKSLIASFNHL